MRATPQLLFEQKWERYGLRGIGKWGQGGGVVSRGEVCEGCAKQSINIMKGKSLQALN